MAVDAVPCGRGDGRRQAMIQSALVATLRTASAAAGLCWDRWIWARADDGGLAVAAADEANLAVILSRQAFDDIVRPGGASLREPDFRLVAVAVKEYPAEAWLRVPSLRPDELVVDRATVTAGDAAGDLPGPPGEAGVPCGGRDAAGELPGPPGEAGVPCGGRDAGATPFAEGVTTGGQPCPVVWGTGQPWVLRASSSQSNMRCSRRERAIGSQCMSAPSASVNGTSTLGPGRAS